MVSTMEDSHGLQYSSCSTVLVTWKTIISGFLLLLFAVVPVSSQGDGESERLYLVLFIYPFVYLYIFKELVDIAVI